MRVRACRPLEKLECANPAVGNIRVGNWRGKAVAVKYYAGWSAHEFRRYSVLSIIMHYALELIYKNTLFMAHALLGHTSELAAMVLTSGCKQIVKVLGAHAPEDHLPRHDNPFQVR